MRELAQLPRPPSDQADRPARTEKRAGWRQHGILVVAEQDPRLTWPERELIRSWAPSSTADGRRPTDERADQADQGPRSRARGDPGRRSRRPAGAPLSGRSIRSRGCCARARLQTPCTTPRGTSKRRSSSRIWSRCGHCRCCASQARDAPSELNELQLDARRRVQDALDALGGLSSPAGSCVWHVVGRQRSLRDWALRQCWSGRPLPQGHAQGILVAALGILAARTDSRRRRREQG